MWLLSKTPPTHISPPTLPVPSPPLRIGYHDSGPAHSSGQLVAFRWAAAASRASQRRAGSAVPASPPRAEIILAPFGLIPGRLCHLGPDAARKWEFSARAAAIIESDSPAEIGRLRVAAAQLAPAAPANSPQVRPRWPPPAALPRRPELLRRLIFSHTIPRLPHPPPPPTVEGGGHSKAWRVIHRRRGDFPLQEASAKSA